MSGTAAVHELECITIWDICCLKKHWASVLERQFCRCCQRRAIASWLDWRSEFLQLFAGLVSTRRELKQVDNMPPLINTHIRAALAQLTTSIGTATGLTFVSHSGGPLENLLAFRLVGWFGSCVAGILVADFAMSQQGLVGFSLQLQHTQMIGLIGRWVMTLYTHARTLLARTFLRLTASSSFASFQSSPRRLAANSSSDGGQSCTANGTHTQCE